MTSKHSSSYAAGRPSTANGCIVNRRPARGGGFTLIELVAVMVVVSILALTAAPALSVTTGTRAGMAATQLHRDLTYARQHAVATGARTWVVFDTGADSWSLLGENPLSPGRLGATALTDPGTGEPFLVTLGAGSFRGVDVLSAAFDGDVEVGFDWIGRPLSASENALSTDGVVTLNEGYVVGVAAATGHVTLTVP